MAQSSVWWPMCKLLRLGMDMAGDRSDWATEGYSAWLHKTRIFETLGSEDWWEERDQVCEWVSTCRGEAAEAGSGGGQEVEEV